MKKVKARIIVDRINKPLLILFLFLVSFHSQAISNARLGGIPICDNKDYLFKNYFYMEKNGVKSKEWYDYYPIVDESISVVDVSVTLIREITAPDKVRLIYIRDGEKSSLIDKEYNLQRNDREFTFVDFDYGKDIPDPQKTPGKLHMILLSKGKPLCRVRQIYRKISYN